MTDQQVSVEVEMDDVGANTYEVVIIIVGEILAIEEQIKLEAYLTKEVMEWLKTDD